MHTISLLRATHRQEMLKCALSLNMVQPPPMRRTLQHGQTRQLWTSFSTRCQYQNRYATYATPPSDTRESKPPPDTHFKAMACFILAPITSEVSSKHYNRTCTKRCKYRQRTVPFTQRNDFAHFLRLEFALENLLFYESVTSYRDYLDRLRHGEHNQGMPFVAKAATHL
jgi:hypothetical protein